MYARRTIARLNRIGLGVILLGVGFLGIVGGVFAGDDRRSPAAQGEELFAREWQPQDARSRGGDGLGPVYNDTSCVACHNLGAPGGGGPDSKNVDILTAVQSDDRASNFVGRALLGRPAIELLITALSGPKLDDLVKVHAGFATARSVVLHHFGTDPAYERWRLGLLGVPANRLEGGLDLSKADHRSVTEMMNRLDAVADAGGPSSRIGGFLLFRSRRNPTALFGIGRIDAIPDGVIEDGSKHIDSRFPEVIGRVSRLKEGRIGRFGWKAQTASLEDFVLTACAVELGLDVPGHHQAGLPMASRPGAAAPGLDLSAEDCAALVAYVKSLPAPASRLPSAAPVAKAIRSGRAAFERVGCAACHRPKLGDVEGLYSDLLLHDMGGSLGDTGSYSIFAPGSPPSDASDETPLDEPTGPVAQVTNGTKRTGGATRQEWRTPPLWGLRDSAPYLHDGRARTLEQAIALHAGEAQDTAKRYFRLDPTERLEVQSFLKSLVAPEPSTVATKGE